MKCISDIHYMVVRGWSDWQRSRWWDADRGEPNGDIEFLDCAFCEFRVAKRYTRKPRTSKSGLGRYNIMRAAMVKHLHAKHRERLGDMP